MAIIDSQGLAYVKYIANGSEDTFQFFFNYLDEDYIEVYFDGIKQTNVTILSGGFTKTDTKPNVGTIVLILRKTPSDEVMALFKNQSSINKEDLNKNGTQVLHVMQEVLDQVEIRLPAGGENAEVLSNLNMNNFRIINLGNAVDDTDGINLGQVKELIASVKAGVTVKEEEIVAVAGQTVFNLQDIDYVPGYNTIACFVDGITQGQSDFTEASSKSVEFDEPALGGERYLFRVNTSPANSISIKQADYETLGGVILARDDEAMDGTDRLKAITPASLSYVLQRFLPQDASIEQKGVVQLADVGEYTGDDKATTPDGVQSQIDNSLSEKIIYGTDFPNDNDGTPDGTIYFKYQVINPL